MYNNSCTITAENWGNAGSNPRPIISNISAAFYHLSCTYRIYLFMFICCCLLSSPSSN